jgi:hypothetical protein
MESHFDSLQTLDGKDWGPERFRGRVTVVSFTDQKSQEPSTRAASALGKRYMDKDAFQIVTAVKVPSMFKGLASQLLKAGQVKARESAAKRFESEGKPVPAGLAERIHVVFDINGKCAGSALDEWKDGQAQLLLVDGDGTIVAHAANKDAQAAVDALSAKLDQLLGAQA